MLIFHRHILIVWLFFSGSLFKAEANFNEVFFGAEADFSGVVFEGKTDFNKAVFEKRANFLDAKFSQTLDLSQVHFKHTALFYGITLPDTLILTDAQLYNTNLELNEVQLKPEKTTCFINLEGTDLSQITLDYRYFTLYFNTTASPTYQKQCYQHFMQQFLANEEEESYQKMKKEYEAITWKE